MWTLHRVPDSAVARVDVEDSQRGEPSSAQLVLDFDVCGKPRVASVQGFSTVHEALTKAPWVRAFLRGR